MACNKSGKNPFYVALLVVGAAFFVTACAYGLMMVRADRLGRHTAAVSQSNNLMHLLDEHGGLLLAGELALLAICTTAAIATDGYWTRGDDSTS